MKILQMEWGTVTQAHLWQIQSPDQKHAAWILLPVRLI